ncbi:MULTISPECIES: hypothetical protein [unclassified Kribbella]|uniref:hypothetical protein n=1 Tax=unclassified Kribbella TaxID=2644121 RepID=UPI0033FB080A
MAAFVQIIEYRTQKPDEIAALNDEFRKTREGSGEGSAPTIAMTCADRDEPGRYFAIVQFGSYDEAMANSNRADTSEFAAKMMELCDGPAKYYNLDVTQAME